MKLEHIDKGNEFDFGRTSADYARFRDIYPQSMFEKLISFGIGKKGQMILDLGSGTAVLPINLSHTGAQFFSTDISENQTAHGERLVREKGLDNIRFRVCPAEDTGFDDGFFDAVTAVQCFHYFDTEKAAKEIHRVLKPGGKFAKIFMDFLPREDDVIAEMERTVLRYNPRWNGAGFEKYRYRYPAWAGGKFDIETIHSYNVTIPFTQEEWLGRIRTLRGVGASLTDEKIREFEEEYRAILSKYDDVLRLKHQIHLEIYRAVK